MEIETAVAELVRDRSAVDDASSAGKVQPGTDGDADCRS